MPSGKTCTMALSANKLICKVYLLISIPLSYTSYPESAIESTDVLL